MWWYAEGWLLWWLAFLLVFFLLPLGYGWAYRGWGPWYRRRRLERRDPANAGARYSPERRMNASYDYAAEGWGLTSVLLWFALVMALIWLVAALLATPG